MHGANHPIPLTRRLVGRYLAFALAGLLFCLVTTLSLAFRGSLTSLIPMAAAGPGILLAFGGLVLHQTVRQSSMIEEELNRVATDPHNLSKVHQLPGNDPSVVGWNALIDRLLSLQSLTDVEQRIVSATQGRKDERLLNVLNSISDGIAVTEKDGAIVFANETILAFLQGNSVDMVLGHNLLQQLDVQRAHNASEVQRAAKQPTGAVVVEIRRSANVQEGVLRLSRNPVQGDSLGRFVWMVRDVTQQALVNVARNEFVSTATHELRTPLANIKAYAETLAIHDGIDVEQQKEFCNIINAEATRLSRFVDEVLNVNQMEAGSLALDRRETDLERLLNDVIEYVQPQFTQKHIDFEVKRPPKIPKVSIDKDKFQAALVNLLGNAAKYTPNEGFVTFEIELWPTHIAFHVQDTGIGIATEDLPRVFEKFYRSQDERVKGISGNGLGLAFTHEVVRLHGGKASVESTVNEGSRFTVTLPL
ncbi:MAG: ATP-binding protein [Planctomycetaceae bacterium]